MAQVKANKAIPNFGTRSIGISIPAIWNNSQGTYYQLGNPKHPKGSAISYGVNINYSQSFYKSVYWKLGIGYFQQNFKIRRPFNYNDNPGQLGYATQSYIYNNIHLFAVAGYKKAVNNNLILNGCVSYNFLNSFRQKYIVNNDNKVWQINRRSMPVGNLIICDLGIERSISPKISFGTNLIIPVYSHWYKDEIFIGNNYEQNEQRIAQNIFSAGLSFSCQYNL
ncbi:hypothetical protein DC498_14395 [Terrimonas sp.]|nr:hypothetical protein DC498_14395 [Terrimonas sp.]